MKFTKIEIGYEYWEWQKRRRKKPIYFWNYEYGCDLFIAKAGYGKSSLCKDIITKLHFKENRQIIVFDKDFEWVNSITRPNFYSDNPQSIRRFHVISNYSIKISDIHPRDWGYLVPGLGPEVAVWLSRIAINGKAIHEDDPEIFYDILRDLPTVHQQVFYWNKKYGHILKLDAPTFSGVKMSILSKMRELKDRFYGSKECKKRGTRYVHDWVAEVQCTKVCFIDMNVRGYRPDSFESFMVGHILEKLSRFIVYIKPIMVIEEADYLIGNPLLSGELLLKSTTMLLVYVTKYRKRSVKLFFISQSFNQLHPELLKNVTAEIYGQIEPSDNTARYEMWKNTMYGANLLLGKRPFIYVDNVRCTGLHPDLFFPLESCCNVDTQGVVFKQSNRAIAQWRRY